VLLELLGNQVKLNALWQSFQQLSLEIVLLLVLLSRLEVSFSEPLLLLFDILLQTLRFQNLLLSDTALNIQFLLLHLFSRPLSLLLTLLERVLHLFQEFFLFLESCFCLLPQFPFSFLHHLLLNFVFLQVEFVLSKIPVNLLFLF
jgi:hypothetical protein